MSTKHTLELSSMLDMLFHSVAFLYMHGGQIALQLKLQSIKKEGMRPCKMGASLLKSTALQV